MGQKKEKGRRKTQIGTVISDKMDKTVTVLVERISKHPIYKKYIRKRAKFKAHDENNVCRIGDKVLIVEGRPLSKEKRWRVREVIEKAV
ncbi:MAG: 30S ribosomal protein S17 [Deltaproteobacteria bacterium]|nr:30S ribosomal protein S17 [Deltaproteobacteria bacterium]